MSEKTLHRLMAVLLLVAACALAGCASKPSKPAGGAEAPAANTGAEGAGAASQNASGAGSDEEVAGPQAGLLAKRTIYFDFDSSEIKGEGTDIVAAHAKYLAANPATRVRLEGHTDERGPVSTTSASASGAGRRCAARCCSRVRPMRRSPP